MLEVFSAVAKLALDSGEYDSGLEAARHGIGSALAAAAKIGMAAVGAASAGVAAFAKSAIDTSMQFDSTMSKVAAISGAQGEALEDLRKKAEEMGASTRFSATEAGDAMTYMAMAGWKTQDMLDGISGIMSLAAASGEDLATTSDIVTDALTAFGLEAKDSANFANTLAAAASNSNTNVGMLGESFKYAAPVVGALFRDAAGGAEQASKDAAIALGLMANAGIKASQGGTVLRGVLSRISKPTEQVQDALDAVGISLDDGKGKMKSLMEVMQDIRVGFKDKLTIPAEEVEEHLKSLNERFEAGAITQKQYDTATELLMKRAYGAEGALMAQYAATIAGQEGMSGLLAIVNASDKDFDKLTAAIYNADGAASTMEATMEDNLGGAITSFGSAMEGLQIKVGEALTPAITNFVKFGRDSVRALTTGLENGGIDGMMDAIGPIMDGFVEMVAKTLPGIVTAGGKIVASLASGIIKNVPAIVDGAREVVGTLLTSIGENARTLMESGSALLTYLTDGIISAIPEIATTAYNVMTGLAGYLRENLPTIIKSGLETLVTLTGTIRENAGIIVDGAIALAKSLAQGLIDAIPDIIRNVPTIVSNIANTINDNGPKILQAGIDIIKALIKGLVAAIPVLIETMPQIIAAIWDTIQAINWISLGSNIMNLFKDGLSSIIPQLKAAADDLANIVKNAIGDLAGKAWTWGSDLIKSFIDGITSGVKNLTSKVSDVAGTVKKYIGFSEPELGPLSNFHTYAPDMMRLFAEGIRQSEHLVTDQLSRSFDFGRDLSFGPQSMTASSSAYGWQSQQGGGDIVLNITSEIDGAVLARNQYRYNKNEQNRHGRSMIDMGANW